MRETAFLTIVPIFAGVAAAFDESEVEQRAEPTPEPADWRLDVFGGYSDLQASTGERNESGEFLRAPFGGWGAGATVRFVPDRFWLGVTGGVSQNRRDDVELTHYRVGLTATSSYAGDYGARSFLFALFGSSTVGAPDVPSKSGFEINAGVGFDMLGVVRLQCDWVRMNVPGYPSSSYGFFFGGVIPLCFGGEGDGCFAVR